MPPLRPQKKVAIPAPQGKKKTFDDDDSNFKLDFGSTSKSSQINSKGSSSRRARPNSPPDSDADDDDEEDDEDDAPEAVGMSAGKNSALRDLEAANRMEMARKEAAKARNQKIASLKQKATVPAVASSSKSNKRKASRVESDEDEDDEDEDDETKRLRARMDKAMGAGEGDSEDGSESFHTISDGDDEDDDNDNEDEDDDEEMEGSFHTDSEDDEDDEDEDAGGESDDSETLEEGPIDNATRIMRERMQAAMEAAERRAGIVHPIKSSTSTSTSIPKTKSSKTKGGSSAIVNNTPPVDEETMWDLGVGTGGVQPLSAEALRRAEKEEKEDKRRKKEKAALEAEKAKLAESGKQKTKKRRITEKTSKTIGEGRKVQLLAATHDPSSGGLPPILGAGAKIHGTAAGRQSQKKFIKQALKASGQGPTKNRVDGRRAAVQTRM